MGRRRAALAGDPFRERLDALDPAGGGCRNGGNVGGRVSRSTLIPIPQRIDDDLERGQVRMDKILFDELTSFFNAHLAA